MAESKTFALDSIVNSPFAKLLGLRLESAARGSSVARMPFRAELLNSGGLEVPIHGGAIAALADFTACLAVWTLPDTRRSATISMTVNYTGPGIRSDLIASAAVRRHGKRVASLAVDVRDTAGALVADALVTYKIS